MDTKSPPKMRHEGLGIDDHDQTTDGGPPVHIALIIVGGVFLVGATVLILMLFWGGSSVTP